MCIKAATERKLISAPALSPGTRTDVSVEEERLIGVASRLRPCRGCLLSHPLPWEVIPPGELSSESWGQQARKWDGEPQGWSTLAALLPPSQHFPAPSPCSSWLSPETLWGCWATPPAPCSVDLHPAPSRGGPVITLPYRLHALPAFAWWTFTPESPMLLSWFQFRIPLRCF